MFSCVKSMAKHLENDDIHEFLLLCRVLLGILASLMIRIIFLIQQAPAASAFIAEGWKIHPHSSGSSTNDEGSSLPGLKPFYNKCKGTGCLQNRYRAQEQTT